MTRTMLAFSDALAFSRAVPADYVDASGATVTAAIGVARLTHDPVTHDQLGLLVEGYAENGEPDIASLAIEDADWIASGQRHTVLHHWYDQAGGEHFDCHFTADTAAAARLNGLLRTKGVCAQIFALAFLPTDVADATANPPGLIRDGDDVIWTGILSHVGPSGQAWTVISDTRATTTGETRITTTTAERITGDDQ